MPTLIVEYDAPAAGVEEIIEAVRAAFAELAEEAPEGVRWTYCRRQDGTGFVALLELADGVENPLPDLAAARHLQATVAKWAIGEPPLPRPLEVLGSYPS